VGVGGHAVEEAGDELDVSAAASGEAELPQFCGSAVVVVDRLIRGIGVDLVGAVPRPSRSNRGQVAVPIKLPSHLWVFSGADRELAGQLLLRGDASLPAMLMDSKP
jgi:hypothetical protein